MDWIVFDLEWNTPFGPVQKRPELPFEIIEIGAVRVGATGEITSHFQRRVIPQVYKRLNPFVAKVTGLRQPDLQRGMPFVQASRQFFSFCGQEPYILCTWGENDAPALRENLRFHHLSDHIPVRMLDVQAVYACFVEQQRVQRSVAAALEHLGLEVPRQLHSAVADAWATGEILRYLIELLGDRAEEILLDFSVDPNIRTKKKFTLLFGSPEELQAYSDANTVHCPGCGQPLLTKAGSHSRIPALRDLRLTHKKKPAFLTDAEDKERPRYEIARFEEESSCPTHGSFRLRCRYYEAPEKYSVQVHLYATPGKSWWDPTYRRSQLPSLPEASSHTPDSEPTSHQETQP